MILCANCKRFFDLEMVEGAGGVSSNGKFIGKCPLCEFNHTSDVELPPVKHSDTEVTNAADALKLSGDNFGQRVVDELYEKYGIFPSSFISFKL